MGLKKSLKGLVMLVVLIVSCDRMVRWVLELVTSRIVWCRQMMVRVVEEGVVE